MELKKIARSFQLLAPELVKAQMAARDGAVPPATTSRRPRLSAKHRAAL